MASNEQWQTSDTTVPYRTDNEQKTVDIADSHIHRKVLKLEKEKPRQSLLLYYGIIHCILIVLL